MSWYRYFERRKTLDLISRALEGNKSSPRLTTYLNQTKVNLQIWGEAWRSDSVSESGKGGGDRVIEVDAVEVAGERCGHVVLDPKYDNKCTECREQHKERNCNEWLEFLMRKQLPHNEEWFL